MIEERTVIEKAICGNGELDPCIYLAAGKVCWIISWPFQGIEGIVIQRNRSAKIVLQMRLLFSEGYYWLMPDF